MIESSSNNSVPSDYLLSEISRGCSPPLLLQQVLENQRAKALEDLTRFLKLVTEQESKYKERLSSHSNFYRRHVMVLQFLEAQIKAGPTKRDFISERNSNFWSKSAYSSEYCCMGEVMVGR